MQGATILRSFLITASANTTMAVGESTMANARHSSISRCEKGTIFPHIAIHQPVTQHKILSSAAFRHFPLRVASLCSSRCHITGKRNKPELACAHPAISCSASTRLKVLADSAYGQVRPLSHLILLPQFVREIADEWPGSRLPTGRRPSASLIASAPP